MDNIQEIEKAYEHYVQNRDNYSNVVKQFNQDMINTNVNIQLKSKSVKNNEHKYATIPPRMFRNRSKRVAPIKALRSVSHVY